MENFRSVALARCFQRPADLLHP
ncbi:MAG: hypothetical protein QOG73_436, partial [Acetobacteraceae bacterium]|nr:hypothetical protein [Acetobacteraceae bacterium]